MARFIIETIDDAHSGMVVAEVIIEGGNEVIIRSEAIYHSHEDAQADVIRVMREAWPDRRPSTVDPSLGV